MVWTIDERARAAVLVPAGLPAHHVLDRRRHARRPPRRRPPRARVHAIEAGWLDRMRTLRAVRLPLRARRVRAVAGRRRLLGGRRRAACRSTSRRSATCSSATASAASSSGCSPTCGRCATRWSPRATGSRWPGWPTPGRAQSCSGRSVGNRMTSRIDVGVGEQHHEAVDADAEAGGGRHAVLEGPQVVLVDDHRLVVAGRLLAAPGPRSGRAARRGRSSSEKALHSSRPATIASKRSTMSGSSRWSRASGETSFG